MTKKELAQMDALRQELALYKAMRVSQPVEPDVAPPQSFQQQSRGFRCHNHGLEYRLLKVISDSVHHADTDDCYDWPTRTNSQQAIWAHSTRSRAYRAARHEISLRAAKKLAEIDALIEAWEQKEQQEAANDRP